jgi:hypothetical protein
MAQDFLAISRIIVSSESALLNSKMLEAPVSAKDWLFKTKDPELCSDSEGNLVKFC